MAERNLIREGFVSNTLAPGGSVSGTQTVSIPEINALVDGDFSTTAITVSGSESILLDADLGARWKLNRIDLYTDEASSANFDMYVSNDGVDFYSITMTGSAGLWSGSVSGTTVSGAPRYIRYEHQPLVDRAVQEWRAINDDSLVDFGSDGTQTSVTISDAPIGQTSSQVTELVLFNKYDRTAQGFVFIDSTGNAGDDNVEISISPNGPWFGRRTQSSTQPNPTPWHEDDYFGDPVGDIYEGETPALFQNVRVVSGTAYRTDFTGGVSNGWSTSGFTSDSVVGGAFRGEVSTSTTPAFHLVNDFGNDPATSPDSVPDISNDFTPFRAADYDTVQVVLTTPTLVASDFVEGPRLFWRDHTAADYDSARSTVSTTPGANFTGAPQTFTFDLGPLTTWSGAVRGFKVQNYTTTTGLAITSSLNSLEVFNGDRGSRIALETAPVISGSFMGLDEGTATAAGIYRTVINTENPIKEPCIITSVSANLRPNMLPGNAGWFLARFANGFVYHDDASEINDFVTITGSPFEVVHFVTQDDAFSLNNYTFFTRMPVLWKAEPGDMIGFAWYQYAGGFGSSVFTYDTDLTVTSGGAIESGLFLDIYDGQTLAGITADLNSVSDWALTGRRINIQFKAISAGSYVANGTYTTPVFDGGADPALLSFTFDSAEENGTSIDVSGAVAFDTVNARASAVPANTATALGRRVNQFALGAHPSDRPSALDPPSASPYMLGFFNSEVTVRESSTGPYNDDNIENFAGSLFYHENNDELWLLNMLISGTANDNMRPIWDVYDLPTGSYVRTQHVTGNITYYHTNNYGAEANAFEPVGWVADYDREEIYVITREDEFSIGAGTYNGMILDLDGEFQDVFWRNDVILQDIVTAGVDTLSNAPFRLQNMRTVAYRSPYFYALTNGVHGASDVGTHIDMYRFGNNPLLSAVANETDIEFIATQEIGSAPGLSFVSASRPVETFTYCSANDLFYFTVRDDDEIYTMQILVEGQIPNETFSISRGPVSEAYLPQLSVSSRLSEGFIAGTATNLNNWDGAGEVQQLKHFVDWVYVPTNDTFAMLLNYRSNRTKNLVREGEFLTDYFLFNRHNHSMVIEVAADTQGVEIVTPKLPHQRDLTWGVLSGTLGYEQVQTDSVLFPTGRYAQLEYTLNSDDGRTSTPYLRQSQVTQGIRVTDIPASGTKSIYLRTNIPEGETVGDQTSLLKVFWELQGD